MNKIVFITGATSGIGRAAALKFAQNNYDVIITGRRKERLDQLAQTILSEYKVEALALAFDVRSRKQVAEAVSGLPDNWKKVDVLVNNAGLAAGLDPIFKGNPEDWETMIDTNLKGLLYITRSIVPLMIEKGHGHVINIGSIAGKEVYPSGNVYCATKHGVDALTRAMRIDLLKHHIRVTQIAPGAVETEFSRVRFKGDDERAANVYAGYIPLRAEDVAEAIYYVTTLPPHVNINDLVIMPTAQANAITFDKKKD
jgi:NADP-dependent 3-hydroxy acid dehydrogenase YdfG